MVVDKRKTAPRFDRAALLAGLEDEMPVWDVYHDLTSKVPSSVLAIAPKQSPVGEKEEEIEVDDLEELEKLDLNDLASGEEEEEEEEKEQKKKWTKERAKMKDVILDLDEIAEIDEEEKEIEEEELVNTVQA
jgi:hypothetical protein